ncbi:hypothetical protein [Stenotrophomonas rhizophila]|uniref:hypothetical protein n=1 Tax=Stenotrophomonas rhizophila TaxID=216778 RepID=UPI00161CC0FD|nr:hypothetical protein [Stenotrophomonas rhizophila]
MFFLLRSIAVNMPSLQNTLIDRRAGIILSSACCQAVVRVPACSPAGDLISAAARLEN